MSDTAAMNLAMYRTKEAAPYWEGLERGVVQYQYCTSCQQAIFYPRTFCPYCMVEDAIEWRTSSGRGTLYTYSEVFVPPTEKERDRVPYVLGIVEMDEGFFLFGEIVADGGTLRIGMRARADFVERNGGVQLNFMNAD